MKNNNIKNSITAEMVTKIKRIALGVSYLIILCLPVSGGPKMPNVTTDYTKGEKLLKEAKPWNMGPLGIEGYFPRKDPRQILVSSVAKGSPADGKLLAQDVILGINPSTGKSSSKTGKFTIDSHLALALAIENVEKKSSNNKLSFKVWRPETKVVEVKKNSKSKKMIKKRILIKPIKAKVIEITLTIPTMGSYSNTSPWKCEKTEKLIEQTAKNISDVGFYVKSRKGKMRSHKSIDRVLDALGLLSTGDDKYLPQVKKYAHSFISRGTKLDISKESSKLSKEDRRIYGIGTWAGSFDAIFLCEYYLRTKDAKVLPAIKGYATYLAKGVSGVGTWSHGVAAVYINGMYGPPCAYGAMNQASALCAMSLVLAQKCGIKDRHVDRAVDLSLDFFTYYVNKGCLPYGDHPAVMKHDENGRMAIAAVLCDLAGRKKEADYYTRMTVASHLDREGGHSTDIFSWQWGALGAARGGPQATVAFTKSTRYFSELSRHYDGGSKYQAKREGDSNKTPKWSTAGTFLMQYCLPRKALYITGKGGTCVTPIVGEELEVLLKSEKFNPKDLSDEDLLAALGNYSVVVRERAAIELGLRSKNVVSRLLSMLDSKNRYARYGACQALYYTGRKKSIVFDTLISKVESDADWDLRHFALKALNYKENKRYTGKYLLGLPPKKHGPALLKLASVKSPAHDPRRKLPAMISNILFDKGGMYSGESINKVDKKLLAPAMISLLENPNGATRSSASSPLPFMEEEGMKPIWGALYHAMKNPAPSGVMFSGGLNINGNTVMAKHHIKEGLPLATWWILEKDGWGNYNRKKSLGTIAPYGKLVMPAIEKLSQRQLSDRYIKRGINLIKKASTPKKLKSIQKYIRAYQGPKK